MNAGQVKQLVKEWTAAHLQDYPGLVATHLVGGITTTPNDVPFPLYKDVDFHLIFPDGSPTLQHDGPFSNNLELFYNGLMLEGGLKSVAEYQSSEAVLSNPEIAHHLTVASNILYDPTGLLHTLHKRVVREYARRQWVVARIEHERTGINHALGLMPMAQSMAGGSGVAQILGYSFTYVMAALCVATLRSPSTGSRAWLRGRDVCAEYQQLDLYEDALRVMGVVDSTPERVKQLLAEGAEVFDLAVAVKRTPHPFGHKMQAHLRPYFVDGCTSLIEEGYYREALLWITPYYVSSCTIMLIDGPDNMKPTFAARAARFLEELGMGSPEARTAKITQAQEVHDRFFALALDISATHPSIVD